MANDLLLTAEEEKAIEYVKGIRDFYGHVFMYLTFVVIYGFAFGLTHPVIFWCAIGWGCRSGCSWPDRL